MEKQHSSDHFFFPRFTCKLQNSVLTKGSIKWLQELPESIERAIKSFQSIERAIKSFKSWHLVAVLRASFSCQPLRGEWSYHRAFCHWYFDTEGKMLLFIQGSLSWPSFGRNLLWLSAGAGFLSNEGQPLKASTGSRAGVQHIPAANKNGR